MPCAQSSQQGLNIVSFIVKAAIAAARAKKQQQLQREETQSTLDPFSTPMALRTTSYDGLNDFGPGSASKVVAVAGSENDAPDVTDRVVLEWGGKTTEKLLSEARRTGALM